MSQAKAQTGGFYFDDFFVDAANRQLRHRGEALPLNSKYFDVLLLLISEGGRLVEKQRIFETVWGSVFVTDAALTQCIKDIRKQLGDDASNPRYIKTVPKHGYIFIGNAVATSGTAQIGNGHLTASQIQPVTATENLHLAARPYKFLDYYTEQDSKLFFGREAEIAAIGSQILARRSFILHGRSGVGKSSIIRAGLAPQLRALGNPVFVIRSFTDPLGSMLEELADALNVNDESPDYQATTIAEAIEQAAQLKAFILEATADAPQGSVIFFLDQFEEFFSLLDEAARERFIAAVGELFANNHLPVKLVFALREDYLAEMSQFKIAIPEIFHHEYRLKRLSRDQAARAITEPALAVGCQYEPQLVGKLLQDLSDHESFDPPQLQIVCDRLFDARNEQGLLTLAAYEGLGTASQILASYLERVLRRFNTTELKTAKAILTALIADDGRRLVLPAAKINSQLRHHLQQSNDENRAARLIDELIAARIARRRYHEGEAWLELAHDFLTPEISRWLTAEERELKQARSVLERAIENYTAHQLMIDNDALDVVLPFAEQLGLTKEEAVLLTRSLMARGRQAPEWLLRRVVSALPELIDAALQETDAQIRLSAIDAAKILRDDQTRMTLRHLALWDKDLAMRKAASIALADWLQTEVAEVFVKDQPGETVGTIRRAISLAMARDYDKQLIRLNRLSPLVSLLMVGGLMWVRLLRGGRAILLQGTAGMLGAAASGLVGGLMLALALAIARQAPAVEAASLMLVLVALGTFIGGLGGFGVSFGMVAATHITYRHSRWWSVVGGAAGGAAVGGVTNLLGVDIIRAVFGQNPSGITGALEGAVIGAGVSLGAVLITEWLKTPRGWQRVLGAALGGCGAGILLTIIGGNLFSGSLEIVARSFADSQIRLEPLAPYFSRVHYSHIREIIFGGIEGLMFATGLMTAIEFTMRKINDR
ncbi:MAG: winged helix-turn-helix domain-containing protein [Acidobacteriota bacterium]